jgi:hypothetical protein
VSGRRPLAVLLPKFLVGFCAAGNTAGIPFLAGDEFLGAFAKFQKATICFVMSACLTVRPKGPNYLSFDGV